MNRPTHCVKIFFTGCVVVSGGWQDEVLVGRSGAGVGLEVLHVDTERDLLNELVRLVNIWDPDILVGYEVRR